MYNLTVCPDKDMIVSIIKQGFGKVLCCSAIEKMADDLYAAGLRYYNNSPKLDFDLAVMERVARKAIADRLTDWNEGDCHLGDPSGWDKFDVVGPYSGQVDFRLEQYEKEVREVLKEELGE